MQIHLDPLGGWSGDMFVAACLDAFPAFQPAVEASIAALGLGPGSASRLVAHADGVLTGRRFLVVADHSPEHDREHRHDHRHHHDDPAAAADPAPHGNHRAWRDIRHLIAEAPLAAAVRDHAVGIFTLLARAEGEVHGRHEDEVTFHEVGAIDSIVDIVAAGQLIASIAATRWTASPLPLGGGRALTAHGLMPVPAPATALLLRGLAVIDDGIAGERVTPTGAAIARYLLADRPSASPRPKRLVVTGTGFGTRTMPGLSNCLRLLGFDEEEQETTAPYTHRDLGVVCFEVDDQSAEDLAQGLDHVRALEGVHDVIQSAAYGKKGRMTTHVQVLVAPTRLEAAIEACFNETTTIGLRHHLVHGAALTRRIDDVDIEGRRLRIKTVTRPDGRATGKAEAADVADQAGHAARAALRRTGEAAALSRLDASQTKRA